MKIVASFIAPAVLALVPTLAFAGGTPTSVWDGGGVNNKWSKPGNWQGGVPTDGSKITFTGTTRLNPNNDLTATFKSITFDENAGAFTLTGGDIKIRAGGINNESTENQIFQARVIIDGSTEIENKAGLTFESSLTLEGGDTDNHTFATFSGKGDTTVKDLAGEFAEITKQGKGTLTANGIWNTAKISLKKGDIVFGQDAQVTSEYLWLGTGTSGLVLTEPPAEFTTLTVKQGAQVQTFSTEVGSEVNSLVDVLVKGRNTVWSSNSMTIGVGGIGLMTISDGANVNNVSTLVGSGIPMASNEYAFGSLTVDGSGSKLKTDSLTVGLFTSGLLTVMDGGKVSAQNTAIGILTTEENEKSGLVLVTGTGSIFETKDRLAVGAAGLGGMGVTLGGKATAKTALIGDAETASGLLTVEGDGSVFDVKNSLVVGNEGFGGLVVANKGQVTAGSLKIGKEDTGVGQVSVTGRGTLLETENNVIIGEKGTGAMDIYGGGKVKTNGSATLGVKKDSSGSVIVSGGRSRWTITDTLTLGDKGSGRMWVSRGAKVFVESAVLGRGTNSYGELLVSGRDSRFVVDDITVGGDGEGLLTVSNKGSVLATSGITVGEEGTVVIGDKDSTAGYLVTPFVNLSTSSSVLKFAHESGLSTFNSAITGNGVIRQSGDGSTFIQSSNAGFTGRVVVSDGVIGNAQSDSFGSADIRLTGGMFAVGRNLDVSSLTWGKGQIAMLLGSSMGDSVLSLSGDLTQAKGGGHFALYGGDEFEFDKSYDLIDVAGLNDFSADQLFNSEGLDDLTGSVVGKLSNYLATFAINSGKISVKFADIVIGGDIDNTGGPFTPTDAKFLVENTVVSMPGAQQVNSLTFTPGSFLDIMGSLNLNQSTIDVPTGTGVIRGNLLTTSGNFTKLGQGLLNVLSNMIVAGDAEIRDGKLAVNGTLTAGDVIVELVAWLKGSGLVNANVINKGVLAPGNSPGTLTISGNFTQTSSGSLQEEIASLSNFDRLIVSGTANLAGNLDIVPFNGFELEFGQQFQGFVQAGRINGEFDSITAPDGFRGRVLQNGGTLTLVIAPESYTQVAKNQNQVNVAEVLNTFIGASGDKDIVSTALDIQTADQYGNAFDQIMPGFYSSLPQISLEQITAQNQFITQRLSAIRLGVAGFNAQGINMPLTSDKDGKSVMDCKDCKTSVTPANATKWALWVQGSGIFGRMSLTNLPTNRYASGGFLGGGDYRWSENFSTGIYSGYQGTYSKYSNNSSTQINSTLFGLYATYQNGGFYSDAIVGGAYNNYSNRRAIEFSTINRTAQSDVGGGQLTAYLDAGYDFTAGKFTFGPLASVQYTYTGLGGFTENGADSLDLAVDQYNANSIRTNLGGRIAYTWNVTSNIVIVPEVRIFWQHEYLNDQQSMSASLDGGSGPGFDYQPSAIGQDSVFAGAGASVQFGPNWNAYFYYNADFGRQDYVGQMISGGLNFKF